MGYLDHEINSLKHSIHLLNKEQLNIQQKVTELHEQESSALFVSLFLCFHSVLSQTFTWDTTQKGKNSC